MEQEHVVVRLRLSNGTTYQSKRSARLLNQIEAEYLAAQHGLTGFAEGARHAAISARLENMGNIHQDLHTLVGDEAIRLVAERLETL